MQKLVMQLRCDATEVTEIVMQLRELFQPCLVIFWILYKNQDITFCLYYLKGIYSF